MTKVKICGFTEAENAREAAIAGVDAVGLVFYDKSPRNVDILRAQEIIEALPPFVNRVGLFVNANPSFVDEVLCEVPLDTLQFHGDESNEFCSAFSMPFIKAISVEQNTDIEAAVATYPNSSGVLLDSHIPGQFGGTGTTFDWSKIPVLDTPVLLAGGLTADNAGRAIDLVHPYAVDVSGGVESSAGVKDAHLITKFIEAVQMERQS